MKIEGSYLLFYIGEYQCALEAAQVMEITRMVALEPVPAMQKSVRGIFHLRGTSILCLDLLPDFTDESSTYDSDARIIILQSRKHAFGLMASSVIGIKVIDTAQEQSTTPFTTFAHIPYIHNVRHEENGFTFFLDIEAILPSDEIPAMETILQTKESDTTTVKS